MKSILHQTENDLPEKVRRTVVELLNQELADILAFKEKP